MATMIVSSGLVVTSKTIGSAYTIDRMYVYGFGNDTSVSSGGSLCVESDGRTNRTTLYDYGFLYVSNGGYASSNTVFKGAMFISSGGTAQNNHFYSSGGAIVFGGGSALDNHLSSATLTLLYGAGRGGYASSTVVSSNGSLFINGNATATATSIYAGGTATVYSGGHASNTDIFFRGHLVLSGGEAAFTSVGNSATMEVRAGASATSTTLVYSTANMYVSGSGASAFATTISKGKLHVSDGGFVSYTSVLASSAIAQIGSGGTAVNGLVQGGGSMLIHAGGSAKTIYISSGGRLNNDGIATGIYVYSSGRMTVNDGGVASNPYINSSAVLDVYDGGRALGGTNQGNTYVSYGGLVSGMRIHGGMDWNANMYVYANGQASNVVIEHDGVMRLSGGTATEISVSSGGSLLINQNGKVTDRLTIKSGAVVFAEDGGVVDFDVAWFNPGEAFAIVNDISLIQGTPTYTITVASDQAEGTYSLAGGATGFDQTVKVFCSGTELGSLTVGKTATLGGQGYTLNLASDLLSLTVGAPSPTPGGTAGDLNMDGRADIVMTIDQASHPADGSTGAWLIQENQTATWGDLSTRNPGFVIFGTGKTAAGKNTDDIYIKNSDNLIGAWTTDDGGKVTGWETVGEFDAETQIVGLGDFNGNGQTDLLLRNNNGAVGCFFTGGKTTGWNYFQSLGDEWQLSAVGDLNGDGRDDVVLKHNAGFAGSWLTQSDGTMAWADLDTLADGFEIVGAGDFDGDGTDDVLLKNCNYYGAWLVNNGNAAGWMGLGDLGDVTVEQIADFNGDGKDDLRIRTAAGDLGAQLVMAADTLDWHYYGSVGAEWSTSLAALS